MADDLELVTSIFVQQFYLFGAEVSRDLTYLSQEARGKPPFRKWSTVSSKYLTRNLKPVTLL